MAAATLLTTACGDDGGTDGASAGASSAEQEDTSADAAPGADSGDTTVDEAEPGDGGDVTGPADTAPPGTGTILADLCAGGQFVDGAISIDDLVAWGVFATDDVRVDGPGPLDATAYNDFGALCNVEAADGGDFLSVGMTSGSGTYDGVAERQEEGPTVVGDWSYYVVDELTPLVMLHTDADGTRDTLYVNWFPDDDDRGTIEEYTRVLGPLAEAIASTTVDIPRLDPPATPDWFVCDGANAGVAGLDPTELWTVAGGPPERSVVTETDILASFGFTECTLRPDVGLFPTVTVQVQDPSVELQDTVASYLAGWPEAQAETIAGVDVAVRIDTGLSVAVVFTVLDGVPLLIRTGADDSSDGGDAVRAAAELVLSSIG